MDGLVEREVFEPAGHVLQGNIKEAVQLHVLKLEQELQDFRKQASSSTYDCS